MKLVLFVSLFLLMGCKGLEGALKEALDESVVDVVQCIIDGKAHAMDDDFDADGVENIEDNCMAISNADQRDSNADGFGNICDPDLDNDGDVDADDLSVFSGTFGTTDADADLNGDGIVNGLDVGPFRWFYNPPSIENVPPGPSAGSGCN